MRYGAPLRRRRSRRRSLSESPPHIPNFSPFWRAYWRQSSRTTQPRQTSFASRVDPPLSGKKRSGSTPKQLAERCHVGGCVPKRNPVASAGRRKNCTMSVTGGSPRSWSRRSRSFGGRVPPAATARSVCLTCAARPVTRPVTHDRAPGWHPCNYLSRSYTVVIFPHNDDLCKRRFHLLRFRPEWVTIKHF